MSYTFGDDVILLTKQLIQTTSGCNEDSEIFKQLEKYVVSNLQRADTLFFMGQKELDRNITSLCDKFIFHGFPRQAKELKRYYDKLLPEGLAKQERLNRMNVIKFLLCISESPTNNFYKYPQRFDKGDEEAVIDWPKYLKEGIPRWSPPLDDESSDNESDNLDERFLSTDEADVTQCNSKCDLSNITADALAKGQDPLIEYHISKTNLLANVQSEWFNQEHVCFKPVSDDKDANVALLWDAYIRKRTKGLIHIEPTTVISEYKMMREVIWQFYEPHSSSCFKFKGNTLVPDLNVTIASVRTNACKSFLHEFIPYIDWLQTLREFHESLICKHNDSAVVPPDTYRSYDFALQTITDPLYVALKTIENKIRAQETTVTLLTLANEIRPLFQTVRVLKDIHSNAVLDFESNSPLRCATTLLWRLHKGLFYASSKLEQDLYLTLYLHSLYKYFTIIQSWLGRDVLEDCTGEFVIADENPKDAHVLFNSLCSAPNQPLCDERIVQEGDQDWQMQFSVKDLDESARCDSVISIISREVLQIGKNIHLLRLLGKLHLVPEFTGIYKESFYEAYIKKILENISQYFNIKEEIDEALENEPELEPGSPTFVFPATCPDECKYLTEMDKLENLVDTSDCFLVQAFESFFVKKPEAKAAEPKEILFEKIQKVTQSLFPVQQMVDDVFVQILRERFSISGRMVKNVLINDYNLEKQFVFLKTIFLFKDDLIFPFYRRIFQQMESDGSWGNHTWLTSYLQDIIMDAYPNFYEECNVEVKDNWKLCTDPLKACQMICIQYRIRWPVNIIIRKEHMVMYKDLFQFILKTKWALYTLNHLYFAELEPRGKPDKNQHKYTRKLIAKLKILRFGLLNIFSSIQHYILGHIFSKFTSKFEKALEEAYDLESLLHAHADFVQILHKSCIDFQEYNKASYGFYMLLYLVRKLRMGWRNLRDVTEEELDKLEKSYWMCHKKIDPIINPTSNRTFIYDE